MSTYKPTGIPNEVCRTWHRWILVKDGEETVFDRKKHALMCAMTARTGGKDVALLEETLMRFRYGGEPVRILTFRTDISNQIES